MLCTECSASMRLVTCDDNDQSDNGRDYCWNLFTCPTYECGTICKEDIHHRTQQWLLMDGSIKQVKVRK